MTKEKKHEFTDRYPYLMGMTMTAIGFIVLMLGGAVIGVMFVIAGRPQEYMNMATAAGGLLVLLLYWIWFRPCFQGHLIGGRPVRGLLLGWPFLISWVTVPIAMMAGTFEYGPPTLATLTLSLAVGVGEEAVFRGVAISTILKGDTAGKRVLPAMLLSSIIFGVTHITNLTLGADTGATIVQVVGASLLGLLLSAMFIRSGNLIPCIIVHTLNDILAFLNVGDIQDGVVTGSITWASYLDIAAAAVMAVIALWIVRPAKRKEIVEVWDRKWRR